MRTRILLSAAVLAALVGMGGAAPAEDGEKPEAQRPVINLPGFRIHVNVPQEIPPEACPQGGCPQAGCPAAGGWNQVIAGGTFAQGGGTTEATEVGESNPPEGSLDRFKMFWGVPRLINPYGGVEKIKSPYLGIATERPAPALSAQLSLPPRVGLAVIQVDADSPAGKAGVKLHDVLHKINEQIIVNQEQLIVLVRTFKAGDDVTLTVIRGGKSLSLKAKLTEKEVYDLDAVLSPDMAEGIPAAPGGTTPPQPNLFPGPFGPVPQRMPFPQPGIQVPVPGPVPGLEALGPAQLRYGLNAAMALSDDKYNLTLTLNDKGEPKIVVTDKAGKKIFEGKAAKGDELKELPDDAKKLVEKALEQLGRGTATGGGILRSLPSAEYKLDPKAMHGETTTIINRDGFNVKIVSRPDGTSRMEVADGEGKKIFDGDIKSAEDLQKLPEKVRQQIESLRGVVPGVPAGTGSAAASVFQLRLVHDDASDQTEPMVLVAATDDIGPGKTFHVHKTVLLDQTDVKSAKAVKDDAKGNYRIDVAFTDSGARRFAEVTKENKGKRLAIVIDGALYSAPMIQTVILGGQAQITGQYSEQVAKDLAAKISAALPKK